MSRPQTKEGSRLAETWTERTFFAWLVVSDLRPRDLSVQEALYLDSRWGVYDQILCSKTPSQAVLKMDILRQERSYKVIDYAVLAVCFSQRSSQAEAGFDPDVVVRLIDGYSCFDDAVRNPKFLKFLFKCASTPRAEAFLDLRFMEKIVAHALVKFPDLKKMNFMQVRPKNGKPYPRFSDEKIRERF